MEITPDEIVIWSWGAVKINATLIFTWVVMAMLVLSSWAVTRRLRSGVEISAGQHALEAIIATIRSQIQGISGQDAARYLPFIASLYLFIAVANLLGFVPGYEPPTGSLSTTAALALLVFLAVPVYSIAQRGVRGFLRHYIEPTPFMLPFHVIGDISRTIALAVRLFGNVMSGTLVVAVLLSITPLFFPVIMQVLELVIGQVQAFIFAVLAMVYIASAASVQREREGHSNTTETGATDAERQSPE